jgi:hypothetical protein
MAQRKLHAGAMTALDINGISLANQHGAIGIKAVALFPESGRFDGKLLFTTLRELGPHDPKDRYHRIKFQIPTSREAINRFLGFEHHNQNGCYVFKFDNHEAANLELTWFSENDIVYGKYTVDAPVDIMIEGLGALKEAEHVETTNSTTTLSINGLQATACFSEQSENYETADSENHLEAKLRGIKLKETKKAAFSGHLFKLTPEKPLYFTLATASTKVEPQNIDHKLGKGLKTFQAESMKSSGSIAGCAEAIEQLVGFMKTYDPEKDLRTVPVNRAWGRSNAIAPVFCWDNFFDSCFASLYDPELAKESLSYIIKVLEEDFENSPPQRNLIVPILYSKTIRFMGDWDYAEKTFSGMMNFMRFWFSKNPQGHPWRDGNDDGLIECGSMESPEKHPLGRIVQSAFDETGYDDSPMYSDGFAYQRQGIPAKGIKYDFERGTLNLTMIGQNSLYVAACRSMAVVAKKLGKDADLSWLKSEADRVAELIKAKLFCKEKGYYQNRFFNGEFSEVKTMTLFYPLLAEICDEETKARLKEILLDPEQFWGEYVIPTVSRDDPAYCAKPEWDSKGVWKGNYWRGYIWAPTNYISYLSIRHAGWNKTAAEFAKKSRRQFMQEWEEHRVASENYPPEGRTDMQAAWFANGGRCAHYAWASCLPMISLEELFSVEDTVDGIRFGTLCPENFGSWENFKYLSKNSSIKVCEEGVLFKNGENFSFESNAPLAVKELTFSTNGISFKYQINSEISIKVCVHGKTIESKLKAGVNEIKNFSGSFS